MSLSKLTVGQYSALLLDLKTTHTDFIGLNILSLLMLKSKHKPDICCMPMALGVKDRCHPHT